MQPDSATLLPRKKECIEKYDRRLEVRDACLTGKIQRRRSLLEQPFKNRRLGHFGFNLVSMDDGLRFYTELLGFRISDIIDYSKRAAQPQLLAGLGDPNGYFTRYGGDHHELVLFLKRVREALGRHEKAGMTINQIKPNLDLKNRDSRGN